MLTMTKPRREPTRNYPKQRKPPETECVDCKAIVPCLGSKRVETDNPKSPMLCQLCFDKRRRAARIRTA